MDSLVIDILQKAASIVVGYVFGLFSTALVVGLLMGKDVRKHGSGNLGSTNALRTLGWLAGVLSFVGDIGKAVIYFVVMHFFVFPQMDYSLLILYGGLGLTFGHNFPIYLKFKGGKGIAVLLTIVIAYDWRLGLIPCIVFIFLVLISRFVSLGSLLASAIVFLQMLTQPLFGANLGPHYAECTTIIGLLVVLAWFMHRENIKRLLKGEEKPFKNKKK
ncbi:MAG: glycerol-3-phosphate acyltransferase [Eggerthellaceae bacterium]|nr:glycerol-3-phosphate acyltransferase [Eggerthellaceae bacterium]